MTNEPLLTDEEHRAMDLLAELRKVMRGIINAGLGEFGVGDSHSGDSREVAWHIHGLQNMVLAQAAARAYPERYRLLGGGTQGQGSCGPLPRVRTCRGEDGARRRSGRPQARAWLRPQAWRDACPLADVAQAHRRQPLHLPATASQHPNPAAPTATRPEVAGKPDRPSRRDSTVGRRHQRRRRR